ncbi:unnamed protein product [Ceutorhynchus assimilis]|uniref:Uncharacterized protein n=1 Tax=Ceutorhynchus assimilis TaxID=467358 RepID=A0A9N9QNX5_9CUCU|nr:unnamed protein product [Ceutorhynchus assimilis]
MKLILAVLAVGACAVLAQATIIGPGCESITVDRAFVDKQTKVLTLFQNVKQPCFQKKHMEIVESWDIEKQMDKFEHPEVVDKIMEFYNNHYQLPKGEIFSIANQMHLEQAMAVFDLLYYAKDFETFYKTAVVLRHFINEGMFLYTYSVALIHRKDTYGIVLPPIYEIYPHYFFDLKTIQQAYRLKETNQESQTIYANYTSNYMNMHPEQSMAYYHEDLGMNSFYYSYHLYYPFWMNGTKYEINHDRRGELWLFIHHQMFARYYMERLSNGFGQIDYVDFDVPMHTFYNPFMQYPNGMPFPQRSRFAKVSDYFYTYGVHNMKTQFAYDYYRYKDYVRRISDAIDKGFAINKQGEKVELYNEKDGYDHLGNLLQANPDSPDSDFYGPWLGHARKLMGISDSALSPYKIVPSAMEHIETTLRDPGFYQLYKQMIHFMHKFQYRMEPYKLDQLKMPGVSIKKVQMDQLITYYDEFTADLSQAVFYSEEAIKEGKTHFRINVKQPRLNHIPFTYTLHVESDKKVDVVVKTFIGPQVDQYGRFINITDNRWNFFEIEKFTFNLQAGENKIKRFFGKCNFFTQDKTSFAHLQQQIIDANKGGEFKVNAGDNYFKYPLRFALPKGQISGLPVQFYFFIYPLNVYKGNDPKTWTYRYPRPGVGGPSIDTYNMFYPLDRPIKYQKMFQEEVPNSYFFDTKIFHKKNTQITV